MSTTIVCARCKKELAVADASLEAVQCGRCRFINRLPKDDRVLTRAPGETILDGSPPPAADDWEEAAEMEKTATAFETVMVVRRRKWFAAKPDDEPGKAGGPPRRQRHDLSVVLWAMIPLAIAVLLLFFFVPWNAILHPNGVSPPAPVSPPDDTKTNDSDATK